MSEELYATLTAEQTLNATIAIAKGDKGDKGDAYIITEADKQEIKEALSADINELKSDLDGLKAGGITPDMTDFVSRKTEVGSNKFDKNTMVEYGKWWYYASGNVKAEKQDVSAYQAITIPVEPNRSYVCWTDLPNGINIYSYFVTDSEYNILVDGAGTRQSMSIGGITYDIPEGGTKLLLSTTGYKLIEQYDMHFACNEGTSPKEYEDYKTVEKYTYKGINDVANNSMKIMLPSDINCLIGDTLEIFSKDAVSGILPSNYYLRYSTSVTGKCFMDKLEVTPTVAATENINAILYDENGNIIDQSGFALHSIEAPSSPQNDTVLLMVGDSLTEAGNWCNEFMRRISGTGGIPSGLGLSNIRTIGTRSREYCNYEGAGGAKWQTYTTKSISDAVQWITCEHSLTDADQHSKYVDVNGNEWKIETIQSGRLKIIAKNGQMTLPTAPNTLSWVSGGTSHETITYTANERAAGNPFWFDGKVDFSAYAESKGANNINYCYVLLGWNEVGTRDDALKTDIQTFISNLRGSYPDCQIVLIGLPHPSMDGIGNNYGVGNSVYHYMNCLGFVYRYEEILKQICAENTNVYYLHLASVFDSAHGYPTMMKKVNSRSDIEVEVQSNGIHPNMSGQYQIADAVYRDFCGRLHS